MRWANICQCMCCNKKKLRVPGSLFLGYFHSIPPFRRSCRACYLIDRLNSPGPSSGRLCIAPQFQTKSLWPTAILFGCQFESRTDGYVIAWLRQQSLFAFGFRIFSFTSQSVLFCSDIQQPVAMSSDFGKLIHQCF